MSRTHKIQLYFNNVGLAGQDYGEASWFYQVEPTLKFNHFQKDDDIILIWDDDVTIVTSSFFIGFFKKLAQEIGYDGIVKHVRIQSSQNIVTGKSNHLSIQDIT